MDTEGLTQEQKTLVMLWDRRILLNTLIFLEAFEKSDLNIVYKDKLKASKQD